MRRIARPSTCRRGFNLLEMLIDWKAAGLRHETHSLTRSLEINTERHQIPAALATILQNTLPQIDELATAARAAMSYPHVEDDV